MNLDCVRWTSPSPSLELQLHLKFSCRSQGTFAKSLGWQPAGVSTEQMPRITSLVQPEMHGSPGRSGSETCASAGRGLDGCLSTAAGNWRPFCPSSLVDMRGPGVADHSCACPSSAPRRRDRDSPHPWRGTGATAVSLGGSEQRRHSERIGAGAASQHFRPL